MTIDLLDGQMPNVGRVNWALGKEDGWLVSQWRCKKMCIDHTSLTWTGSIDLLAMNDL